MPKESVDAVAEKSLKHAKQYLRLGNYGRAFAHYLVVLRLSSSHNNDGTLQEDFIFALGQWGQELEKERKIKELFDSYEQALELFPVNDILHCNFGAHLFRLGYFEEAAVYFHKAVLQAPNSATAKTYLDNVANALVERWHFGMLNCVQRNQAFKDAIKRAISKGQDTVLDIGAGTGILSMFAYDSGAKDVYACEMSPTMHHIATETLKVNEMFDKICLLKMTSTDIKIPEHIPKRVALVLTETFDSGLFGEHVLEILIHAWQYLLIPPVSATVRGQVIPSGASVWACLIECPKIRQSSRWNANQAHLCVALASRIIIKQSENDPYTTERLSEIRGGYKKLCLPVKILDINFNEAEDLQKLANGERFVYNVHCIETGRLDAIAVWFDLHLDEVTSISTCPESGTCWEQAIYPTLDPGSDGIQVDMKSELQIHVCYEKYLKVTHSFVIPTDLGFGHGAESHLSRKSVALSSNQLIILNDHVYRNALNKALVDHSSASHVMLSSAYPLAMIDAALQRGIRKVGYLCKNSESELILHQSCDVVVESGQLTFETEASLLNGGPVWNILVIDVIENSGIIRSEAISEISILRECALQKPFSIIPSKVTCFAVLIESNTLLERNRVMGNDRTLGYRIGETMNAYKVMHHQDLDLWTLPHTRLTEPLPVLTLDFVKEDANAAKSLQSSRCEPLSFVKCSQNTTFVTIQSGSVTAIAYWFEIHLANAVVISTLDIGSHWNHSAIVLDDVVNVVSRQSLILMASCDNGHLAFVLEV